MLLQFTISCILLAVGTQANHFLVHGKPDHTIHDQCVNDAITKWGDIVIGVTCCDEINGKRDSNCEQNYNITDAQNICESIGRRICTRSEIYSGKGWGAPCGFDDALVWTMTECITNEQLQAQIDEVRHLIEFDTFPNQWSNTDAVKLTPSNSVSGALFGESVAISNGYIVVGASGIADGMGYAYVLDRHNGDMKSRSVLLASDGASDDYFGGSVAISNEYIVIGARYKSDIGSAYVFERDHDGSWHEVQKLTASDASSYDYFGVSVAISNGYIVVGADGDDDVGSRSGSAYVFERDHDGGWGNEQKLKASDASSHDHFGASVAISNEYIVVGADGSTRGFAYVFERDHDGSWNQAQKLTASDGASADYFGRSVAISNGYIVVGAEGKDHVGINSGSAYVFERDHHGSWNEVQTLTAFDASSYDYFGSSVAISNGYIVVGAEGKDHVGIFSGSAYVFERVHNGFWKKKTQKLTAFDASSWDYFGVSVAISNGYIVVGAYGDDDVGSSSGAAYFYDADVSCP